MRTDILNVTATPTTTRKQTSQVLLSPFLQKYAFHANMKNTGLRNQTGFIIFCEALEPSNQLFP